MGNPFFYDKEKHKYFGEIVSYEPHEKKEAEAYLMSWKKFLIRRLTRDSFFVEIVEEQWEHRSAELDGRLAQRAKMGLKLCLEGRWTFEIE